MFCPDSAAVSSLWVFSLLQLGVMSLFPCYDEKKEDNQNVDQQIILGKSYQGTEEVILFSDNQSEKKRKKKKEKKKRKHREVGERSDSDFDSDYENEHHKKLLLVDAVYLPNGNVMQAVEQSNQLWKVDKEKDKDFLQMGSFYRLDIPEYDITLLPQSIFGQVRKKTSRDRPQRPKNLSQMNSHRYSLRSRYFNDSNAQNTDSHVYRPRTLLEKPDKRIKLTSFLIPFPPPLPRDDQVLTDDTLGPAMKSDIEVLTFPNIFYSHVISIIDYSDASIFLAHHDQQTGPFLSSRVCPVHDLIVISSPNPFHFIL
jgi:hypothetical protein